MSNIIISHTSLHNIINLLLSFTLILYIIEQDFSCIVLLYKKFHLNPIWSWIFIYIYIYIIYVYIIYIYILYIFTYYIYIYIMVWLLNVCSNSFIKTQYKIDIFCTTVFLLGICGRSLLITSVINWVSWISFTKIN